MAALGEMKAAVQTEMRKTELKQRLWGWSTDLKHAEVMIPAQLSYGGQEDNKTLGLSEKAVSH